MVDLQRATITGSNYVLGDAAIEEFRGNLRGQLILPADDSTIGISVPGRPPGIGRTLQNGGATGHS